MTTQNIASRLAVCSWSLQPEGADQLLGCLKKLEIPKVQIALDPIRTDPERWADFGRRSQDEGIQLVSGMFVTVGEDYSSLEAIRKTGGVVPDATWEENWANIQDNAKLAKKLGLSLVTFHAGFLPEDESLPDNKKLRDRLEQIGRLFGDHGIGVGLETGQETAPLLLEFLNRLNRPNVGVNFDPANMILYDKGDPMEALRTLAPRLMQCHIKDGTRTKEPGTWGEEVAVGTGHVDWALFFRTLQELNYTGHLAIEREAGEQRMEDIKIARTYVTGLSL